MKWRVGWCCGLLAVLAAGQSMRSGEEKKNPLAGQKSAIQAGGQRFREGCAACHGANAEGGRGPKLVQNRDLYRLGDEQVFNIVRRGIAGTSMPPSQMPDEQTWQVVAFVRSLSSPASEAIVEGDAEKGRTLFYGAGECKSCHALHGEGGPIGPDLTNVGATLTVAELRESIEHPSATITPGFEAVKVRLKDGSMVQGVAKDDSYYSIQVLDERGRLHLINKSDAAAVDWSKDSLMPSGIAAAVGESGVDNLIAFLARQVVREGVATAQDPGHRRDVQ